MKNWLYMSTFAMCLLFSQNGYAQAQTAAPAANPKAAPANQATANQTPANQGQKAGNNRDNRDNKGYAQDHRSGSSQGQCPADHPCEDQPMGECYCLMVHYEPCYYTTKHCVEEKIPCKKKCWRKVPQCYEVQKCKMVPEYYTETCTKYVDECYEEDDYQCVQREVCEQHCEYVPQYYWKHTCENPNCPEKCKR